MTPPGIGGPEQTARETIDRLLSESGWTVQSPDSINLTASRGVAIREFKLGGGYSAQSFAFDGEVTVFDE